MSKYLLNCYERVPIPEIYPLAINPYLNIEEGFEILKPCPIYRYYTRVDEYIENERERSKME